MKDDKETQRSLDQFEKIILPGWLLQSEYEETRRMTIIAYISVFIAVFTLIILGSLRLIRHETVYGLIDLAFALVMAGIVTYHRKTEGYGNYLALNIGISAFGVFCICLFFFSGYSKAAYLWSYTFPLMAFPLAGSRRGTIAVTLFLIPVFSLLLLDPAIPFINSYPRDFVFTFIPSILAITGLSYLYEKSRERNQHKLNLANAALRQSNEEMEKQIQERTAELARSEESYRFLTERMSDIIWTTDMELNVTYISPSVQNVLGFTQEKYRKLSFQERVKPDSFNRACSIL
jgi:PAS domain-containing protein